MLPRCSQPVGLGAKRVFRGAVMWANGSGIASRVRSPRGCAGQRRRSKFRVRHRFVLRNDIASTFDYTDGKTAREYSAPIMIHLKTNLGAIILELFENKAP